MDFLDVLCTDNATAETSTQNLPGFPPIRRLTHHLWRQPLESGNSLQNQPSLVRARWISAGFRAQNHQKTQEFNMMDEILFSCWNESHIVLQEFMIVEWLLAHTLLYLCLLCRGIIWMCLCKSFICNKGYENTYMSDARFFIDLV